MGASAVNARVDWLEGARIALLSLRANRLRTGLTTLGIAIGISTLLAIVGIIQGLNGSFAKQLASLGSNSLFVSKMPWVPTGNWWEFRNRKNLTLEHAKAIREVSSYSQAVAWQVSRNDEVSYMGGVLSQVQIVGSIPDYLTVSGFDVTQGRFFTEAEDDAFHSVAVIGMDLVDTLFPHSEPLGASIRIGNQPYRVVGVLSRKGKLLEQSQDLTVIVPFQTFTAQWGRQRGITIGIAVDSPDDLNLAEEELIGILRRLRATPPEKPDDFSVNRAEQLASTYQQLTGALYAVAVGIGLITLLVGGIGIMNMMLVSVRERTREIGIRRALGARRRTIVIQFLLEAIAVSCLGGGVGTAVGLTGATIVSWVTPLAASVEPLTVLGGIGFSAAVGLLFGIWPAARAAKLHPVEALRYE